MYGARQKSGPASKLAGASIAVIVTAVTAGLVRDMVANIQQPTVMVLYDAPEDTLPPAPERLQAEIELDVPAPEIPPLIPLPEEFVSEEPVLTAAPEPVIATPGPTTTGAAPDRRPRLRSSDKPVYPAASIRAQEQGFSGIEVCVNAQGRVTSAALVRSSGHARLDEAAMKWVRDARFSPGVIGGQPASMCGHEVVYEWSLKDA
jgi:TonB family protein